MPRAGRGQHSAKAQGVPADGPGGTRAGGVAWAERSEEDWRRWRRGKRRRAERRGSARGWPARYRPRGIAAARGERAGDGDGDGEEGGGRGSPPRPSRPGRSLPGRAIREGSVCRNGV
ncbi:hypothetical protein EG861_14035 [Enterococcus faecalis]|nr:hypothetical protein EG861_14035 [Enterococcus faecalis]